MSSGINDVSQWKDERKKEKEMKKVRKDGRLDR